MSKHAPQCRGIAFGLNSVCTRTSYDFNYYYLNLNIFANNRLTDVDPLKQQTNPLGPVDGRIRNVRNGNNRHVMYADLVLCACDTIVM